MSSVWHRIPCVVLMIFCCGAVAHANPVAGTAVPICPTFSPSPGSHNAVEIAFGSDGCLAVWKDTRGKDSDIFGCRISATGEILDVRGIAICTAIGDQTDPAVAWNGTDYLVVWADRQGAQQHICCTRVRTNGEVLDPQGVCLSGTTASQAYPRVASDGAGWEVVWQDSRGGSQDIYGRRVSGDGSLGRLMGIVTIAGNSEEMPDIAYNGSSFVVVWCDQRNSATTDADLYACRVAKNGLRMGSDILVTADSTGTNGLAGAQNNPRICQASSGNCMVVWEDYRTPANNGDIYAARIDSTGHLLDKLGKPIATGTATQEMPSIGYDGTRALVAWRDKTYRFVRGTRVSTTGSVLDSGGFNISLAASGSTGISVSGCPTSGFWVGWSDLTFANDNTLATRVPSTGTFAGSYGTLLSLGQDDQAAHCVVDNGSEYAVVWSQRVGGKSSIMAARVSHAGDLLTPTAVNLTGTLAGDQKDPSIAWNGSEYLVVWSGSETYSVSGLDIRGLRLDSALKPKDAAPLSVYTLDQDQVTPTVASNGNKFLVVWDDYRNAPNTLDHYTDLYGAIVDANGNVTPLATAINQSLGSQHNPRALSNGTDYYVVWEDYRSGSSQIYGVKVSATGSPASSTGTKLPATATGQLNPSICYGGGYYFVTWTDGTRITGCRVSGTGVVTDSAGLSIDSGAASKKSPASWWDGTQYQTVWEDYRSAFVDNADIYYATTASNGVVSSDPRSALVADLIPQLRPAIFGGQNSGVLFYSSYENFSNGLYCMRWTQQGLREIEAIRDVKQQPAGTLVLLRGKVVTGVFQGYFYIEEFDRTNGIKVVSTVTVHLGDVVDVSGIVGSCDAEKQITTGSVSLLGAASEPTMPYGVRGDMLGGAALGGVSGITGAGGANNIGLLVKTWGTITSTGSGYFYIEAKPGTQVKVKCGALAIPMVGKVVAVTGISTCDVSYGSVGRAILPRQQSDIQELY